MDFETPTKFDVYDEPGDVTYRWEKYVKLVKIYLAAKEIDTAQRQRAILLNCAGRDVQDIVEYNLTDTGADFATLVQKISEHFEAQNNVVFQRYQFRQCIQQDGEIVDSWHRRLCIKARNCEYESQTDSIIRDQIVACCSSNKLRRMLLETPNISLQETLKTTRSLEAAEMHAKTIEKNKKSESTSESSLDEISPLRQLRKLSSNGTTEQDWVEQGPKKEQQQTEGSQAPSYGCSELGYCLCDKTQGKTCRCCRKGNYYSQAFRNTLCLGSLSRSQKLSQIDKLHLGILLNQWRSQPENLVMLCKFFCFYRL